MRGRLATVVVCVSDQLIVNEIPGICSVSSRSAIPRSVGSLTGVRQ